MIEKLIWQFLLNSNIGLAIINTLTGDYHTAFLNAGAAYMIWSVS